MNNISGIQQALDINILSSQCPLSYIGGKRWLVDRIKTILKDINLKDNTLVSPFCGASSIEIAVAATGAKVIACDRYDIIVNFYKQFQKHPNEICKRVVEYYPINPDREYLIEYAWEIWNKLNEPGIENNDEVAALTWFVNKNSWRGVTFFRPPQIRPNTKSEFFEQLCWWHWQNDNISFHRKDYKETLEQWSDYVLYLDPPYFNRESLYNHYARDETDMDHLWLRDHLINRKTPWILCHDYVPEISEMYSEMKQVKILKNHGFNRNVKPAIELVITNF